VHHDHVHQLGLARLGKGVLCGVLSAGVAAGQRVVRCVYYGGVWGRLGHTELKII
jgi:hypothetical protein